MFVDFCEVLAILFIQISRVIEAEEKKIKINKQKTANKQQKSNQHSPQALYLRLGDFTQESFILSD